MVTLKIGFQKLRQQIGGAIAHIAKAPLSIEEATELRKGASSVDCSQIFRDMGIEGTLLKYRKKIIEGEFHAMAPREGDALVHGRCQRREARALKFSGEFEKAIEIQVLQCLVVGLRPLFGDKGCVDEIQRLLGADPAA